MKTKALLISLAGSSLCMVQPAAAATRSYESIPINGVQAPAAVERAGAPVGESEELGGIWMVFVALGLAALLLILLSGEKSPG